MTTAECPSRAIVSDAPALQEPDAGTIAPVEAAFSYFLNLPRQKDRDRQGGGEDKKGDRNTTPAFWIHTRL